MWLKALILIPMLLVQIRIRCQTAQEWSAEKACLEVTRPGSFENQNDPTCGSYVFCYMSNGSSMALVFFCTENSYHDATLGACTTKKPEKCI
ncbi:GL24893 [Drosophila persimilis]|uniref:GL24893 n=1 Tax=Drosophila persimilis TaxID=7234 RepID=B4GRQ4_DROPE|nr:GL24893 [Drosophila persimilis]